MTTTKAIRFAVIGARRGNTFVRSAQALEGKIQLVAICDIWEEALKPWQDDPTIRCYSDFHKVLDDPEIDAVCIATPLPLHAQQSIAALRANKHVLCEVTAMHTLQEAWELIKAVEESGKTYMMAENYCFMRDVLMIQNMVDHGVFGDLIYASGAYIHDCRHLFFTKEGDLTWRGRLRKELAANSYPTHSLGPVCKWLDINRTDSLKTTASWHSLSRAMGEHAKHSFPERAEYADENQWLHPDTVTTLIRTQKGKLIETRNDWISARPHHMTRYELQGTRASFTSSVDPKQEPMIWIKNSSPVAADGKELSWEPLYNYASEFEHPLWREHGALAKQAGHGGGDYFVLREFYNSIEEGRPPLIDVYDAVTWSSITPLSALSIAHENTPVDVPNFQAK